MVESVLDVNIRKICSRFGLSYTPEILAQLARNREFISQVNERVSSNDIFHKRLFKSVFEFSVYRNLLYYLVRVTAPQVVVETGVFHGVTSTWILKALEDNDGDGRLVSIDLPRRDWDRFFPNQPMGPGHQDEDELPPDIDPGWFIPDNLRHRWELLIGPSSLHLESTVSNKRVDLFIHDSDHGYQNMKFEIETALRHAPGALLVIDNYDMSTFCHELLAKGSNTHAIIDDVDDFLGVFARTLAYSPIASESSESRWVKQLEARRRHRSGVAD